MNARLAIALVTLATLPSLGGLCGKSCAWAPHSSSKPRPSPLTKNQTLNQTLNHHRLLLDASGKILPWTSYGEVARLAFKGLASFPLQTNGLPTYFSHSRFEPETLEGVNWPHNPASLNAMLVDSAIGFYAYSADRSVIDLVAASLDHQLAHGTTPEGWTWSRVPFSSADPGATDYHGADDAFCDHCGRGDGVGHLEPDKVGELGYGYLRFFELTGELKYRDAALACAIALAKNVRPGDETHSPWPFRVNGEDGTARDEYSADVIGPIMLFDELQRLGLDRNDAVAFARARGLAWDWLLTFPLQNDVWGGYFEDIPIYEHPADNPNQYSPLQTAHYLLDHPELDRAWREHVTHLLSFTQRVFAQDDNDERGVQFGAEVLSEQKADMAKMASHTARYGSIRALWFDKTGDLDSKEKAARSLAWATYWCNEQGLVKVGADDGEGWWFSDGYGDYIRHFLTALGAVPEWAPAGESHLLRSTTVITRIDYEKTSVRYVTFDPRAIPASASASGSVSVSGSASVSVSVSGSASASAFVQGEEVLRIARRPSAITLAGKALSETTGAIPAPGYTLRSLHDGGFALVVRRSGAGEVVIEMPDR